MVCVEQRRKELQLGWLGWYETWLQEAAECVFRLVGSL